MIMRLSLCACSTSSFQRVCSCTTQPAAANSQTGIVQADDSAKPAGDGQLQHPQKFVMGWMTLFMKDNLLKHGNNNIILLDATFGTNHMKMPLYTALVIDEFGNGVSAFMGYRPSWFTSLHARVCYARASTRCYARASTRRTLASGWQLCCSMCGKVTLIGCAHASWLMTLLPRSMPSGRQP